MTTKLKRHPSRATPIPLTLPLLLFSLLVLHLLPPHYVPTALALEATYTPNPADSLENHGDGGPLPLSTSQRQQLLQLELAIVNSQDPSSTLAHVANQNQMSSEELAGMLQRNHRDLEETGQLEDMLSSLNASMAGGGVGGNSRAMGASSTLPRRIVGTMISLVLAIVQTASVQIARRPRQCTLLAGMLLVTLLAVRDAPRNGIVLSTGSSFLFSGHTTILPPPVEYLMQYYVERDDWETSLPAPVQKEEEKKKKKKMGKANKPSRAIGGVGMTRSLPFVLGGSDPSSSISGGSIRDDDITVERVEREGYALIVTARKTISLDPDQREEEEEEEAIRCMHDAVLSVFDERKFSEFIPPEACVLKFRSLLVSSENDGDVDGEGEGEAERDDDNHDNKEDNNNVIEGAVMAVKSLGNFGLYGIQPLCFSYEEDGPSQNNDDAEKCDNTNNHNMIRCLAFHTIRGGHFDGEIRFSIHETPTTRPRSSKSKKTTKNDQPTDQSTPPRLTIVVTLAIPHGGRAPPSRLADLMISSLLRSICRSSEIKIRQTIARRRQSQRYRANASGRASEKRHLRYEQEKFQEEMAAERKRRWKRNNPDAGHYRPSGHRLRSPNNC